MTRTNGNGNEPINTRRQFLTGALLGGGLASQVFGGEEDEAASGKQSAVLNSRRPDAPYDIGEPENTLYTACLQCNTGCGIKAKIQNGIVTKIDGNPYSPWTMLPHLDYETAVEDANPVDGALCPKGYAGLQTAYDPYRIRHVLKRAGKRGENKWKTIPFERAIKEICDGGKLFADVPGEEDRHVEGLRDLMTLTDPDVAKAMADDVKQIWDSPDEQTKREHVEQFKRQHAAHLHTLIDPDHPDLGPKNNQIVASWGRLKGGRSHFYRRFVRAMGSVNAHGHTTVCQGSLYFGCQAMSNQYVNGSFSGGRKFYWQSDTENARFVLFVGANLFEANYGPPNRTVRLTDGLVSGRTKIAVADPRFSKLASKAWKWLPLQPGTDIPLAIAIIRWMFDHERYDKTFLRSANKAAATQVGEPSYANGTWLVEIGEDGRPGRHARAADHGIAEAEQRDGYTERFMIAMVNGVPTAIDPNSTTAPVFGDLFVDTTLPDGTRVKSGLQLLAEAAREHTIEEWAEQCGVQAKTIEDVAWELTSYGKQAGVDIHRGPAQHTNGFYAVLAWMSINVLLGNIDYKGGMVQGASWDVMGRGGLFGLGNHPGAISPFGVSSIRHELDYEKTTLFEGYPAKRPWYPLASDVYQEVIPSIDDQYPYPVKVLFMYKGAPTYALPAGDTNIKILADPEKLPLFIANDIVVGMTSMYADYIFPDTSFLERWEFHGTHFSMVNKVQPVRQPVMGPIPANCEVYGHTQPICFESMMLGIAEYMNLPGFGESAFGDGLDLKHPDELYLRATANLAFGERPDGSQNVPDSDAKEIELFIKARRHLPKTVFDEARWKQIVGEKMWPKVVYVLSRGGRFENHEDGYSGDKLTHAYARLINLYQEKTATTIHSGTGKHLPGYAKNVPITDFRGGDMPRPEHDRTMKMITHRTISRCKSRTVSNPWLTPLMPDNGILINPRDAERLGLKAGQKVKITSSTNPTGEWDLAQGNRKAMIGNVVYTQTMRPGVVSFALGYGHWATGATDITINGQTIKGHAERANGLHANAAMWTDEHNRNTCLSDTVGGSVSFYDTRVTLEPV
jgi:tetrathionate reductase subunit A